MTNDTTVPSYWLNWRFAVCAVFILVTHIVAGIIIRRYEGFNRLRTQRIDNQQERVGTLYKDEAWRTCWKVIHPAWLLVYRLIAFCVLLALLISNAVIDGGGIFYFYTQWTFTLVTLYFGVGILFSVYGYCRYHKDDGGDRLDHVGSDAEQGTYAAPTLSENVNLSGNSNGSAETDGRIYAGCWGYFFQIVFQTCAGAVVLTDCVFWLIIYPFLTDKDYRLNFLIVGMHSINAVFLLGDVMLNHLRFPFFRIVYFVLWTCMYVVFQWIVHLFVSMWWPYPFLELSSPYAPIWYVGVGLLHLPCFGVFSLIVRAKGFYLTRFSASQSRRQQS